MCHARGERYIVGGALAMEELYFVTRPEPKRGVIKSYFLDGGPLLQMCPGLARDINDS